MCSNVDPLDKVNRNAFTHKNMNPCQPCSHICHYTAVDLGMTLLPVKLLFLCPSFFFCWLFVGWFSISVSFIQWCVERGEKYASSSVYPVIDLVIGWDIWRALSSLQGSTWQIPIRPWHRASPSPSFRLLISSLTARFSRWRCAPFVPDLIIELS